MKILSGLAEGQVLQRLRGGTANVRISGSTSKTGSLKATIFHRGVALKGWRNRVLTKKVSGSFEVHLSGIPMGGPYRLELSCEGDRGLIRSFFVGDTWILAGQSNMEGYGNRTGAAKPHPFVHAFSMRHQWRLATEPLHVLQESPDSCHTTTQCSPEQGEALRRTAPKGVGPGLFFAREMWRKSRVPQGLICTAHGGTTMEQWAPARKGKCDDTLYGSMLRSVRATGQPVAGMLWYQGEGDAFDRTVSLYTKRMLKLVAATRRDLGQPTLPWITAQIARLFAGSNPPYAWNSIQEQQRLLPTKIKNFETVATIDLPLDDLVHVGAGGQRKLGVRFAGAADRLVYRNRKEKRCPRLGRISVPDHSLALSSPSDPIIKVTFLDVEGGLKAKGEPHGFSLLNDDGKALSHIYKITLEGNTACLHLASRDVFKMKKAALSYGHDLAPICNITDARDLSLPVFGPIPLFRS